MFFLLNSYTPPCAHEHRSTAPVVCLICVRASVQCALNVIAMSSRIMNALINCTAGNSDAKLSASSWISQLQWRRSRRSARAAAAGRAHARTHKPHDDHLMKHHERPAAVAHAAANHTRTYANHLHELQSTGHDVINLRLRETPMLTVDDDAVDYFDDAHVISVCPTDQRPVMTAYTRLPTTVVKTGFSYLTRVYTDRS
jgi:hypothetical protein